MTPNANSPPAFVPSISLASRYLLSVSEPDASSLQLLEQLVYIHLPTPHQGEAILRGEVAEQQHVGEIAEVEPGLLFERLDQSLVGQRRPAWL